MVLGMHGYSLAAPGSTREHWCSCFFRGRFNAGFGYPCEEEPVGQMSVRDAQGYRYGSHLMFLVIGSLGGVDDGLLSHKGEVVGEVCWIFHRCLSGKIDHGSCVVLSMSCKQDQLTDLRFSWFEGVWI